MASRSPVPFASDRLTSRGELFAINTANGEVVTKRKTGLWLNGIKHIPAQREAQFLVATAEVRFSCGVRTQMSLNRCADATPIRSGCVPFRMMASLLVAAGVVNWLSGTPSIAP